MPSTAVKNEAARKTRTRPPKAVNGATSTAAKLRANKVPAIAETETQKANREAGEQHDRKVADLARARAAGKPVRAVKGGIIPTKAAGAKPATKEAVTLAGAKACSKCGEVKPFAEFSRNVTHGDGMQSRCKECLATKKA
jgi:hypothetical protein